MQVDKARSWFSRAVLLDPDSGDFWALYYKFEAVCLSFFPSQFSFAWLTIHLLQLISMLSVLPVRQSACVRPC